MNEKSVTVSVIIPSYNRADLIKRAVQSVLNQTYQDFEIIVVDDGSTDNTKQIVKSFNDKRISYIYHKKNMGAPAARNRGIKSGRGQYFAFLDSDDEWLPEKLEKSLKKFLSLDSDVGLVYSNFFITGDGGRQKKALDRKGPEGKISRDLLRKSFIQMSATLIKSGCLAKIRFDERLPTDQDRDFFIRICQHWNAAYIDEPLSIWHAEDVRQRISTSSDILSKKAKKNILFLKKYKTDFEDIPRVYAKYLLFLGNHLILQGEIKKGREYLLAGIKIWPFNMKLWVILLLSYTNIRLLRVIRKIYRLFQIS